MKNKFLFSLMMLSLIIPCFLFAGCGKDEELFINFENYTFVSFTNSGTHELDTDTTAGKSPAYDIWLSNAYDADSLKIIANGQEVDWTKNSNYDADVINEENQLVGTVVFTKIQEDLNVSVTCEEKQVSFTFEIMENVDPTEEQIAMMEEFLLEGGISLYDACTSDTYVYTTNYSNAIENGVGIDCKKQIGYYESFLEGEYFIEAVNEKRASELYEVFLWGAPKKSKNSYEISMYDNIKKNNKIILNPKGLCINTLYISSYSGDLVSISGLDYIYDYENGYERVGEILAGHNKKAIIELENTHGFDYSNVKVFVNDTEIKAVSEGKYEVDLTKMPIYYTDVTKEVGYHENYKIIVTEVETSNATGVRTVEVSSDDEQDEINLLWDNSLYYYDNVNKIVYVSTEKEYTFICDFQQSASVPSTINILINNDEANKVEINIEELLEEFRKDENRGNATLDKYLNGLNISAYDFSENAFQSIENLGEMFITLPSGTDSYKVILNR